MSAHEPPATNLCCLACGRMPFKLEELVCLFHSRPMPFIDRDAAEALWRQHAPVREGKGADGPPA